MDRLKLTFTNPVSQGSLPTIGIEGFISHYRDCKLQFWSLNKQGLACRLIDRKEGLDFILARNLSGCDPLAFADKQAFTLGEFFYGFDLEQLEEIQALTSIDFNISYCSLAEKGTSRTMKYVMFHKAKFTAGDMVTYRDPRIGRLEQGIFKRVHPMDKSRAFVAFHCAGNWHIYENYTGANCARVDLMGGWVDRIPESVAEK